MYDLDIYKQPFWAENSGFVTGRDPLGIQNSSVSVYARLLPGMTNQTLRLRYYGFFCWLLDEYDKLQLDGQQKTIEHHYNFIRKAELIIAFIMEQSETDQHSIVGSEYTGDFKNEINELGYYDIVKGAVKTKDDHRVYWKYPSGALGQYYVGSLINLDLVGAENRFFFIKERGRKLADSFGKSISVEAQNLFIQLVKKGKLTSEDIDRLNEFAINRLPTQSEEWTFYKDMLIDDDGLRLNTSDGLNSSKRRESLQLFLEYLNEENTGVTFQAVQYNYNRTGITTNDASFGWYYYYINETIHYCIETLFWAMLIELDGKNISLSNYIDTTSRFFYDALSEYLPVEMNQLLIEILSAIPADDIKEDLSHLISLTRSEHDSKQAAGFALKLLFQTYTDIEKDLNVISEFENRNFISDQKGNISEYIDTFIFKHLKTELNDYLVEIVKTIINDHISTAYRKMGNGEANLLKFVIEDGTIGHIQTMPPKFTNPRIRTLNNFLIDLQFIDNSNEVTELGKNLLIELV